MSNGTFKCSTCEQRYFYHEEHVCKPEATFRQIGTETGRMQCKVPNDSYVGQVKHVVHELALGRAYGCISDKELEYAKDIICYEDNPTAPHGLKYLIGDLNSNMSGKEFTINQEVKVQAWKAPNFIVRVANGTKDPTGISVKDVSFMTLKQLAEAWVNELMEKAGHTGEFQISYKTTR